MPKISELNPTDFPKLEHMFPVELNGESNHLTINQVRAILLYSAAEVSFQTGVTVEDALNDLISGKANASDVASAFAEVYTKSQSDTNLNSAISGLVDGATLNTLKKLSTAIANDANFATTITTALDKRLKFDGTQTLSPTEINQALVNIGSSTVGRNVFTAPDAATARNNIGAGLPSSMYSGILAGTILNQWTALAYFDFTASSLSGIFHGALVTSDADLYVQAYLGLFAGATMFAQGPSLTGFMKAGGDTLNLFAAYQGFNLGQTYRARIFGYITTGPASAAVSSHIIGGNV